MEGNLSIKLFLVGLLTFPYLITIQSTEDPLVVKIGVIFDHNSRDLERAFAYGVETANETDNKFKIFAFQNITDVQNIFKLSYSICEHLKQMVFALVCMSNILSYDVIQSYSQALQVPVIVPFAPKSYITDRFHYEIKMNPSVVPAMADYIKTGGWTKVFYLFNSDADMWRLQELYEYFNASGKNITVLARQIVDPNVAHDLLHRIDKLGVPCNEKIFVLDFDKKILPAMLRKIAEVGMNRDGYHYLISGLDIKKVDLGLFQYSGATFTGFDILADDNESLRIFLKIWNRVNRNENISSIPVFTTDLALMVDGIAVLTTALATIHRQEISTGNRKIFRSRRREIYSEITCSPKSIFENGHEILKALKNIAVPEGLTGNIQFDKDGQRTNYSLQLFQSRYKRGIKKIGYWSSSEGLHLDVRPEVNKPNINKVKIITTVQEEPFVQLRRTNENGKPDSDSKWEGYLIDLLKHIARSSYVNFTYRIRAREDDSYGIKQNGTWTGMIGELVNKEADLALAPITITKEREKEVDFTKPFMKTGISIMIKKPDKHKPGVFSFKEPLSNLVWLCIAVGFLSVSAILFLVGRFSPYEWKENSTTGPSDDFNMLNSLWSNLGALMMQGSDIFPRSLSGRTAESAWWFFTLILISSYTANLAAFLTVEQLSIPIDSVDALAAQEEIKYGCYSGGSTLTFFERSKVIVYEKMWRFMQFQNDSGAEIFMESNKNGWLKVRKSKGKYAFLLEEAFNEYFNQRSPCTSMKVGDNLNSFGYGIALQRDSDLSKNVNLAVLHLREIGLLIQLRQKWWIDKGQCGTSAGGKGKKSLSLSNVSGIFHILIGGLVIAMLVSIIEYGTHVHCKRRKKYKVQKKEKMLKEPPPQRGELQPLKNNGSDAARDNKGVSYTQEYQTSSPANLITFEGISENGQTQL